MGLFNWFTNSKYQAVAGSATNKKFSSFHEIADERLEIIRNNAVTNSLSAPDAQQYAAFGQMFDVPMQTLDQLVYTPLPSGKPERLAIYRSMANFPEVSDAFDEISEAFYNEDENGDFVKLLFSKSAKFSETQKAELTKEFIKFISMLDLENNGYAYVRTFLSDGEVCFENIVDDDDKDEGIVALKLLPNEAYDFLRDVNTNTNAGIVFYKNRNMAVEHPRSHSKIMGNEFQKEYLTKEQALKHLYAHGNLEQQQKEALLALPWPQVTYFNSGNYNAVGSIVYPILEKARVAYNQLALMESSAIVYRIARSPERLMFSVSTGKLNAAQAEQAVFKMMNRFNTKKTASPNGGTAENRYDALSPVESFWFPKGEGDTGTTVSNVSSPNVKFNEMEDIKYFVKRLYMALKVPFRRWDDPSVNIEKGDVLPYEEYRFAKFVTRLQRAFAKGIMESFIIHLKLVGLWQQYDLSRDLLTIRFTPPTAYDMYWKQRIVKVQTENYTALASQEEFARETLQRKYLGWSTEDVLQNYNALKTEAQRKFIVAKIAEEGKEPEIDLLKTGGEDALGGLPPAEGLGGDLGGLPTPPPAEGAPPAEESEAPIEFEEAPAEAEA